MACDEKNGGEQLGFLLDADRCIGCKACVAACNDFHHLPAAISRRHVVQFASGEWSSGACPVPRHVYSFAVSFSCNHCDRPLCVPACPQKAIRKDEDGIVYIDKAKCVHCGECVAACPYGAIQMTEETADKCDLCRDALRQGGEPKCVKACPMRCLHFGDVRTLREKYPQAKPFPAAEQTGSNTLVLPNRNAAQKAQRRVRSMSEEL